MAQQVLTAQVLFWVLVSWVPLALVLLHLVSLSELEWVLVLAVARWGSLQQAAELAMVVFSELEVEFWEPELAVWVFLSEQELVLVLEVVVELVLLPRWEWGLAQRIWSKVQSLLPDRWVSGFRLVSDLFSENQARR